MIVRIMGGLGNQLFQYAIARRLMIDKSNIQFDLDFDSFSTKRKFELDSFNIKHINIISKEEVKKYRDFGRIIHKSRLLRALSYLSNYQLEKKEFGYQKIRKCDYLDGYWQHTNYFYDIRGVLLEEIAYKGKLNSEQEKALDFIEKSRSVGIHVRRGDYMNVENRKVFCVQELSYYIKAVNYLRKIFPDLVFFVFSDDIEWCKTHFSFIDDCVFIDKVFGSTAVEDFELLKHCKHHIISNSTFSWWASWLSNQEDAVKIAPSRWFIDEKKNEKCREALLYGYVLL